MNREDVHLKAAAEGAACAVHDWPTLGMAKRLVALMRERHRKGGVDVCRDCLRRARDDARPTIDGA